MTFRLDHNKTETGKTRKQPNARGSHRDLRYTSAAKLFCVLSAKLHTS